MRRPHLHSTASSVTIIIVVMTLASMSPIAGQQAPPSDRPRRNAEVRVIVVPIAVDGVLDEEVWRSTPAIGELVQRQPVPGASPTEPTDVRLLRDQDNLYIGVIAYDSEPEAVLGAEMARDGNLGSDDRIEILLDTFRDQRNAFYFATNPAGALVDGLTYANGQLNTDWDTTWDVKTRRTQTGWTAEFAIPFKSLSFPAEGRIWGFNFSRNIYRRLEDLRWSGARLETQFLQVIRIAMMCGLPLKDQPCFFKVPVGVTPVHLFRCRSPSAGVNERASLTARDLQRAMLAVHKTAVLATAERTRNGDYIGGRVLVLLGPAALIILCFLNENHEKPYQSDALTSRTSGHGILIKYRLDDAEVHRRRHTDAVPLIDRRAASVTDTRAKSWFLYEACDLLHPLIW